MKCQACNFENDDKVIFCKNCGERININSHNINNEQAKSKDFKSFMKTNPEYKDSCLSEAWKKIKKSNIWKKQLIYCGLSNIIPILNFTSAGYALKWANNIKDNKSKCFNKTDIINSANMKLGFFEWVTFIAYGFAFLLFNSIIKGIFSSNFTILNNILNVCLFIIAIVLNCFTSLAVCNMSQTTSFGDSFSLKTIFTKFKEDFLKLFGAYFIPSLICKGISLVAILILVFLLSGNIFTYINTLSSLGNIQMLTNNTIYTIVSLLFTLGFFIVFSYIIFSFMLGIERVIRYCSISIYLKRYPKDQS